MGCSKLRDEAEAKACVAGFPNPRESGAGIWKRESSTNVPRIVQSTTTPAPGRYIMPPPSRSALPMAC